MADTDTRHWVLIETGGNQRYIFGSSRLRHVVGASQLVHDVGTRWVPEAVTALGLPEETVVMSASGKALLLVHSAGEGTAVIRAVTDRALREAPGLQVTGVVGPAFDAARSDVHEPARERTYRWHAAVRAARPDPLVRDRVFPWHRLCRDSGQPAVREERYGTGADADWQPASAGVLARSAARSAAHQRLRERLGDELARVIPPHLEELGHDGWVAVVHADGNGVGGLFRDFVAHIATAQHTAEVSLATHVDYQREVARELDDATWAAVTDAVRALPGAPGGLDGRLLPIVVGGDDVTIACDAALAVPFVRAFSDAFTRHTATKPHLATIAHAATGSPGLSASAGIAVVKPHHPFATAYELADQLTAAAKTLTHDGSALAAFDIHVAHTSTLRELDELREFVRGDGAVVARHAGPYLLGDPDDLPEALRHRSVARLDEVSRWLDPQDPDGWLSATQAHALREAADRSLAEYEHHLALVAGRAPDPARARQLLAVQTGSAPSGPAGASGSFLRLFDALHLRGLRLQSPGASTVDTVSAVAGGSR